MWSCCQSRDFRPGRGRAPSPDGNGACGPRFGGKHLLREPRNDLDRPRSRELGNKPPRHFCGDPGLCRHARGQQMLSSKLAARPRRGNALRSRRHAHFRRCPLQHPSSHHPVRTSPCPVAGQHPLGCAQYRANQVSQLGGPRGFAWQHRAFSHSPARATHPPGQLRHHRRRAALELPATRPRPQRQRLLL